MDSIVKRRRALEFAILVLTLALYAYPTFKARAQFGPTTIPPIFAPDLTLYLNLSNLTPMGDGRVLNPYYRIPVLENGAGYLKFDLAARLFGTLNRICHDQTWPTLLTWNVFWWGCLCAFAITLFERFLPSTAKAFVIPGAWLLMLFNFGVAKTILQAWVHLPNLSGFEGIGLPFGRAFIPVIPCTLLLAYLGLQMEVLRRRAMILWVAMALLQFLTLAVFPYGTLLMAGLTATSLLAQSIRVSAPATWRIPLLYGASCAFLDCSFLLHGSLGFYDNHSPAFHFQPQIVSHLIGWNWVLLLLLTITVGVRKALIPEVRWPLVGLGLTNALLMLGDALIPATKLLLSHHAGYFLHTTVALLITFLAATIPSDWLPKHSFRIRAVTGLVALLIFINGVLMTAGTYRRLADLNRDVVELSDLTRTFKFTDRDLVVARSRDVDDVCGWIPLLSTSPVLFCTDAEVMLTPQQNREIHRFRQAIYLYLIGEDSNALLHGLSAPDPAALMYRLGYWAEAVSHSTQERKQGIEQIQGDLLPLLAKVEARDVAAADFFHAYTRVILIDKQREQAFDRDRLSSILYLERNETFKDFVVLFYRSK